MSNLFSGLIKDLKLSSQTKTFWVSIIGGAIAIGEAVYVATGHSLPDGMEGTLVTIGNAVITALVMSGLIKNTTSEDITAKKTAKSRDEVTKMLSGAGASQDQINAFMDSLTSATQSTTSTAQGGATSATTTQTSEPQTK